MERQVTLRPLPIGKEFILVKFHPFQNEPSGSPWKDPRDQAVRYSHRHLIPAILGMEMWRCMVIVVDGNDDTKESANLGHERKSLSGDPQTKAQCSSHPGRTRISLAGCRLEAMDHWGLGGNLGKRGQDRAPACLPCIGGLGRWQETRDKLSQAHCIARYRYLRSTVGGLLEYGCRGPHISKGS